jgi:hypothetical protein
MKNIAYALIFALGLIGLATPWSTSARVSSPTASGSYSIVLEDGLTKQVEFNARLEGQGATGEMTFRDEARVFERDPESGGHPEDPPSGFSLTARLDSLTIEHNRAVMSGTVRESSHSSYVGKWVQLVVEDNGEGGGDKLTWAFCQPEASGWTPVDAEDPRDEGAWAHWWATDAEVRDDHGLASANIIPGNRRSCPNFLLSTYEFPDARGEGQIQVLQ